MNARHWTGEEMVDHLYGVGPEDGHELECEECQERIAVLRARREMSLETEAAPVDFLRRQRVTIAERLEARRAAMEAWWRTPVWAAVMTAVALVLLAPQPPGETTLASGWNHTQDAGMYLDIYQTISSEEPRALAPMHALFEEQ